MVFLPPNYHPNMKSPPCALAFSVVFVVLLLFIPLFLIYAHLEDLNFRESKLLLLDESREFLMNEASCPTYQFPCEASLNEWNETICIDRSLHCDSKKDCPNGEDEERCDDISKVVKDYHRRAQEKLMSNVSTSTSSSVLTTSSHSLMPSFRFNHRNCSLAEVTTGTCTSCDLRHDQSVICKGMRLTAIPRDMKTSIKTLNLDDNNISEMDEDAINLYRQLNVLSLRNNTLTGLRGHVLRELKHLRRLYLSYNKIVYIEKDAFHGLTELEKVYLNYNQLRVLDLSIFENTPNLVLLDLLGNKLNSLDNESFPLLPRLNWLDLGGNQLSHVSASFDSLPQLTTLTLQNNRIQSIQEDAFALNFNLIELDLGHNDIHEIHERTFRSLSLLSKLHLNDNPIRRLPVNIFWPLQSMTSLNLSGVNFDSLDVQMFSQNKHLTHLYFSRFRYCLYAPRVRVCRPFSDGLSSIHHMLGHPILKKSVWAVALFTCVGNLFVVIWRSMSSKEDEVLSLFVQNLSVSDFLMGVYLLTIGSYDLVFQDKYALHALNWTRSWKCSFCGFIAMLSSELSVLVLTLITVERYRCITASFQVVTASSAKITLVVIWVAAITIATIPLILWPGGYYSSSGLCFPLHINEPFGVGWQFSSIILIGVNLSAVIVIISLYVRMFYTIRNDRKFARPALPSDKKKREDAILAFRFFAIVLTDCLCWLPIVVIKLFAFTQTPMSSTLNAWLVVFVLPINSALNPVIYTMAAPTQLHQRLYKGYHRLLRNIRRRLMSQSKIPFFPSVVFVETPHQVLDPEPLNLSISGNMDDHRSSQDTSNTNSSNSRESRKSSGQVKKSGTIEIADESV